MALSLRIPRVEVFWGLVNLSFYDLGGEEDPLYGEPLVFNVTVSLTESGQNPTGSMMWNPTGAAYRVYEKLLSESADQVITVRYYYLDGRSITFAFVWSGQQEEYGINMGLKVMLSSELDGLTNGILKCTAQANEEGFSMTEAITEFEKFFGVDTFKLVDYTKKAREDMEKTKVQSAYNQGMKFYESIAGVAEENGNTVFASNIGTSTDGTQSASKLIVFTPFKWDKDATVEELEPTEQFPDPKKRYGYFLGPCLVDTISKQSQWQPPQKRQTLSISTTQTLQRPTGSSSPPGSPSSSPAPKPTPATGTGAAGATSGSSSIAPAAGVSPNNPVPRQGVTDTRQQASAKPGATSTAVSGSRSRMRLKDNENGEEKKLLLQEERQCRLSTTLFMSPVFTGLKPYDVLYIPNFAGTFMEDWIVNSVEYTQTDGGVTLSVQASRHFGLAEYMNQKQGDIWLKKAKSYGLVGEGNSLESWMNYGWKPGQAAPTESPVTGGSAASEPPTPQQAAVVGSEVSGFTVGENANLA